MSDRRAIVECTRGSDPYIDGRINFTSNNYLSLARHPHVIARAREALMEDGAGAGSSRLITGTFPRVARLEERIAAWKGTERALVTTSGFAAALSIIPTLVGRGDGIALERRAHASLVAGARLSGASISVWRDAAGLERALRRIRRCPRKLVILDGVHSMDGDIAPLPEILPIVDHRGAMTVIDDAHAGGVLGPGGAGTLAHFGIAARGDIIQMGTLSKALGSQGGFIAASNSLIDEIIQRGAAFIYTTGIAPACVGAALGALEIIEREPERLERLRRNFEALGGTTPIIPVIVGASSRALECARELRAKNILVSAIRPPTVPRGTARIRLSIQADHEITDDLRRAIESFRAEERSHLPSDWNGREDRESGEARAGAFSE